MKDNTYFKIIALWCLILLFVNLTSITNDLFTDHNQTFGKMCFSFFLGVGCLVFGMSFYENTKEEQKTKKVKK